MAAEVGRRRIPRWAAVAGVLLVLAGGAFAARRIAAEVRAWGQFREAGAALEAGDLPRARACLGECLKAWPGSAETHFLAGRAARLDGDFAEAYRRYREAERLGWVPEALELERALVRVPLGEFPEVEAYLTSCVAGDHPDAARVLEVIAPAYLQNFELVKARHYAQRWTERCPGRAAAWACLGAAAERQKDREGALAAYRRAVEAAPDSAADRLRLVRMLLELYRSDEAQGHLDWLGKATPGDPAVRLEQARWLVLRGEPARARAVLVRLAAERPDDAEVQAALGRLELSGGRAAEGERRLRRAAEIAPYDNAVVQPLIQCLRRAGKEEESRRWEKRLGETEAGLKRLRAVTQKAAAAPRDPGPRHEAGTIFLASGQEEQGLRWLAAALRVDPRHRQTLETLAEYYEKKGQAQRAAAYRARARRAAPASP